MNFWLEQYIVGFAGIIGGFAGLFLTVLPIMLFIAPHDLTLGFGSFILACICGLIGSVFGATRCGIIAGRMVDNYKNR